MLVEHRVDYVDEGLVGGKESVASGEEIAFEHSFHGVLAEHLEDAAIGRQISAIVVLGKTLLEPELLGYGVKSVEFVGGGLVGTNDTEVGGIPLHHVGEEETERTRVFDKRSAVVDDRRQAVPEM